ncbi:MAG: biotin/lipoyl-containing protein, partial [Gammaproteobacteria bacterium]
AGIDNVDTSISSMSMTYGHSPTETIVEIFKGMDRDTGLDISLLEEIAAYFREVRKKYASFEGSLKGVDSRILISQVPGGMLTNMENQLCEQGAADKLDDVLAEIPHVREDLGYIPLVTPTSQIVGTQAVLNVLSGERYKNISKETAGVLKGEYGATIAPVNSELQAQVLEGAEPITCRPADLLEAEVDKLTDEFQGLVKEHSLRVAENEIDDVLTYALFPQVGLKFLQNRDNPSAFEPVPTAESATTKQETKTASGSDVYTVNVNGQQYVVEVNEGGDLTQIQPTNAAAPAAAVPATSSGNVNPITAPLAGNIVQVNVAPGEHVQQGDLVIILEAMKMETQVLASHAGVVDSVSVNAGDTVAVGDTLILLK